LLFYYIYNVSLLYSVDYLYDGSSSPVVHNTTYAYSHFGLPGQVIDWGDTSVVGDEKYYNYTYTYNFDSWIVNKLSSESVYDAIGTNVFEMYAINHLNKPQNVSWSIDNIASQNITSINSSLFVFVQTNYTTGVNIANGKVNSTSYNDTEREVILI
jgi:hypothetical protein